MRNEIIAIILFWSEHIWRYMIIGFLIFLFGYLVWELLFAKKPIHLAFLRDRAEKGRKKCSVESEHEQAKDEAMLNSIADGLLATDKYGRLTLFNNACARMLGWNSEEIIGKKLVEVVKMFDGSGNEIPASRRPLEDTLKRGLISSFVQYYKRKDQSIFPVSITVSPIMYKGKVDGAIAVVRDITREKAVEKAKTEFVSLASHQLRTPISIINWYAELLLFNKDSDSLTGGQRKFLRQIHESAKSMAELVNSLLDISRLEMGMVTIRKEKVDILKLANSILQELKSEFDKHGHKIRLSSNVKNPYIYFDRKFLWIILQNLLTNAIKYTPDCGSIDLKIRKKAANVQIIVSDTGVGIPDDQKDRVFSKMFRADNAQRMETQGSGLGLYIVKSIVEKAGGSIGFDSKIGNGTSFYVNMPNINK